MTNLKRAFSLVEWLVGAGVILILAAILFPIFGRTRETGYRTPSGSCQSNLKQISLGIKQYIQDYDEKFPLVRGANVVSSLVSFPKPFGWADAIYPYLKSTQIFQCPSEKTVPVNDATKAGYTDYWMNARLSGAAEEKLSDISRTFLMGDGDAAQGDARYAISALPQSWRDDQNSPAYRHLEGANYAFADGHVKWLKPDSVENMAPPSKGKLTFRTGENQGGQR